MPTASLSLAPVEEEVTSVEEVVSPDLPWVTIVWNDPVNLMSYVTHVFETYFRFPRPEAEARMREVHENGKSVVSSGGREQMEVDVQAMHGFGLWATLQRSGQ